MEQKLKGSVFVDSHGQFRCVECCAVINLKQVEYSLKKRLGDRAKDAFEAIKRYLKYLQEGI